ncbi:glycine/betaine ABC transporter [Halomonas sp. KAO]|uniref:glycine betaine ABC transporter substrate-binding protein n=1 Tax=unclassified Halomonas TaxID=2609666 RepID=UPI00189E3447|nr:MULTISPECIES: glycine betaine ABC transporter substrate-binding protein [unclassified Halomonas]MBF7052234.1 glycine/betaine ABC transporter [Halomonas sp. KAO]MDT0512103.1 glycine betaine ABC transporter substrate-binding protein [Halomonas sp. LES1]MDT0590760.1 glycine betaine ABC transporter substrate-binding protein [Halomonas sp. PAR8]
MRNTTLVTSLAFAGLLPLSAQATQDVNEELRLVAPPWPGITVKSEIFAQLAEPLGYRVDALEVSSTVGYQVLQSGEADAFLAGWLPAQQESYDAAMENGAIVDLGNNVNGARMGFAVPGYVADAGITNAEQLADPEIAERFDYRVYSIENGSTVTDMLNAAIDADVHGLGDWEGKPSSTPGMLSEVKGAVQEERWILFYGWTPHWMVPEYDTRILDDSEGVYGDDNGSSDVKTIVSKTYAEANPNMLRLLDQFVLSADEQSEFIRAYSLENGDLEEVAHDWLVNHPERVATFLEGVTTRDGDSALSAVEQSL